jgi:hypothetical protein
MKRIAFVITSLVLLPSFAYADQQVRAAWYGNELRGHRTRRVKCSTLMG